MTQITISNNETGTLDFAGSPPSSLLMASPSGLSGTAFYGSSPGIYVFDSIALTPPSAPLVGGNFAISVDQGFSFAGGGNALAGTVHWDLVKDDSPNPDLIGTLSVANSTGDPTFIADFPGGGSAHIDVVLAFKYPDSPFLSALSATDQSTWTMISAGEVVPQPSLIPEPSGIALLVVALAAAIWLGRGRRYTGRREVV